ncbi:MAG: saccharopine dehydrogenase C-terminal domain-containing protein [Candidatus Eisenbacteria bacterium]
MKKVTVLGAGMVGSAIAADLAGDARVTVVDRDGARLREIAKAHGVEAREADLSAEGAVGKAVKDADLVIGAVPGFLGFRTLRSVIEAGRPAVDISFFDENPFDLDPLAKEKGVTVVMDCGVAPGMSNIIAGYHHERMKVDSFECLVGGLPVKRSWPHQYKAPFSPIDVVEEYTRPARIVENGKIVIRPALSESEFVEIDPIGTLEASNTDGLRTLLVTLPIPNMVEKTMRYPGHYEYMRVLLDSGFFRKEPVEVNGVMVRPIDVTAKLLFPLWRLGPDEADITVMRIRVTGSEKGEKKTIEYNLFDRRDDVRKVSSMARTTGYTCTAVARLLLDGTFAKPGVNAPEEVGKDEECFRRILADLERHGIRYEREERKLSA